MKVKVAVVGAGAMGRGLLSVLRRIEDVEIVAVADISKHALQSVDNFVPRKTFVTTNPGEVLGTGPDVLIEATGDVLSAFHLVRSAIEAKTNVILLNNELDVTFGLLLSKIAQKNGVILTSDAGDQPGVLARLIDDLHRMTFEVVIVANNKGFLDPNATPESIGQEAAKRRLSLNQCTSFTDGTKLAVEMALVANCYGYDIFENGMRGPRTHNLEEALQVFDLERARKLGGVVDYVLGANPGGSVFVIGYSADVEDQFYMDYYKMGPGPFYLFVRPYHLCHFETPLAIRAVVEQRRPILVQKHQRLQVGCQAKTDLTAGTRLDGIGGFHLRGVLEKPTGVPIGLTQGAVLVTAKKKDEPILWADVEFPTSDNRLDIWKEQSKLAQTTGT